MKIFKYNVAPQKIITIPMPQGAEILSFQVQHGEPCIWALVDEKAIFENRYFKLFGTGHEVYQDMGVVRKFIGTIQLDNGNLVFHLFERIN